MYISFYIISGISMSPPYGMKSRLIQFLSERDRVAFSGSLLLHN
jgi:hypothetical protein